MSASSSGRPRRSARAAAVLAVGLLTVACSGGEEPEEEAAPPPPPRLSELDTTSLVVGRDAFCEAVDEDRVTDALGTPAADAEALTWANGEPAAVLGGSELAHEEGCSWTAADGTQAAAWVFVPPVPPAEAEEHAAAAAAVEGCAPLEGAEAYGAPTVALTCTSAATESRAAGRTVSFRGLFGDAWLTCTLAAPGEPAADDDLAARAADWCAAVAVAASAS